MDNLQDILKKTVIGLGIVGMSYTSLNAQHITGSDYIQGVRPERYHTHCISKSGRATNMNKYHKSSNYSSCNFNSKKHFNSKEYKPRAFENRSECVSRSSKKYKAGLYKVRKR